MDKEIKEALQEYCKGNDSFCGEFKDACEINCLALAKHIWKASKKQNAEIFEKLKIKADEVFISTCDTGGECPLDSDCGVCFKSWIEELEGKK